MGRHTTHIAREASHLTVYLRLPRKGEAPAHGPREAGVLARALPSVSLVVAAHNEADALIATVDGALGSPPGPTLEVVAVNDCSTDATWPRLLELKEKHPELHLVDLGVRYGDDVARLEGARRATGELVCFAIPGADPEILARLVESESRPKPEIVAELVASSAALQLERRPLAQTFPPGIVHLGAIRPPHGVEGHRSERRPSRRRLALVATASAVALTAGISLALAFTGSTSSSNAAAATSSKAAAGAASTGPAVDSALPSPDATANGPETNVTRDSGAGEHKTSTRQAASFETIAAGGNASLVSVPSAASSHAGTDQGPKADAPQSPSAGGGGASGSGNQPTTPADGETAPAETSPSQPSEGTAGGNTANHVQNPPPGRDPPASGQVDPPPTQSPPEDPGPVTEPPAGGNPSPSPGNGNGNGNANGQRARERQRQRARERNGNGNGKS